MYKENSYDEFQHRMIWETFYDICKGEMSMLESIMHSSVSESEIRRCSWQIGGIENLIEELRDGFKNDFTAGDEYDLDVLIIVTENTYAYCKNHTTGDMRRMWVEYKKAIHRVRILFEEYIEQYYGGFRSECF